MSEQFRQYITILYQAIPSSVYEGMLSVFCLGAVAIPTISGFKKGIRLISVLLLFEYVFFIFCSTFLFRSVNDERGHSFLPGWSYNAILNGSKELIVQNAMNVVVFIPVGILLGYGFLSMRWWKALLIGCVISIIIEALQFYFDRGFSEIDDVIHNTLGCMIGYVITCSLISIINRF